MNRRKFLEGAALVAASAALQQRNGLAQDDDLAPVWKEIEKRHDESVRRLQDWIRHPSIAAENRASNEGCDLMMELLRDAGFQRVERMPTDGKPGVFATLDAGVPKWMGMYFMYDVKQADPAEWTSPPFEAALVDKPKFGKCVVGRGAVNQKGPEASFLAALHAMRGAGRKLPVNLVLVAEGEEEIGSPHFPQVVRQPEVLAALRKCMGIYMPAASQDADGQVSISLGAKGIVECELVSSGEKWGRGPRHDVHSSLKASLDSPAWHLVEALATLVSPDGNSIAIEGYTKNVRPLSASERQMIAKEVRMANEAKMKAALGVEHWVHDVSFEQALVRLASEPTINIEGLVAGYTGPGGKTILPHRAVAKIDMRLVPDMTATGSLELLKTHLARHGFGDIEVNMTGGYDPTTTSPDAGIIHAQEAVYREHDIQPTFSPRGGGSWPGYVFTGDPLHLAAGHFGLGYGTGAHAPDEFYVIESSNPKVQGIDGAARSHVEYLHQLARS